MTENTKALEKNFIENFATMYGNFCKGTCKEVNDEVGFMRAFAEYMVSELEEALRKEAKNPELKKLQRSSIEISDLLTWKISDMAISGIYKNDEIEELKNNFYEMHKSIRNDLNNK